MSSFFERRRALIAQAQGSIVQDDALVFYADSAFTIRVANTTANWDGTLYYSTDHSNWNTWTGSTINSGAHLGKQCLYLRGVGNSTIIGASGGNGRFVLAGSSIKCVGELTKLLDYTTIPTIGDYAFNLLFYAVNNCDFNLSFTAIKPSRYCFRATFNSCSSITNAVRLSVQELEEGCFSFMYFNCPNLATLNDLPVPTLVNSCYEQMYIGCSKIKISTQKTGEYQTAYRIPSGGVGINATQATASMFVNTGGTFAGTPAINTTYYTANEVV